MAREIVDTRPAFISGSSTLFQGLLVGAAVGFFGWLLMLAISNWVIGPVFCRTDDTASICSNSNMISWASAHIIMSIMGLFMLIRANVFRPLLVVLAALVTLWGVGIWFIGAIWWVGLLWGVLLFALAYLLYTWLASTDRFFISLVAIIIVVVLMRLLISL